jgi:hypothetical protein
MCFACYALRNIKHIVPKTHKSNLFCSYTCTHHHKLWHNGSSNYANKLFILQKKFVRTITNTKPRDSCREAFKELDIMTFYSRNIYSLALITVNNKHIFDANNEIHKCKTRNNYNLDLSLASLSKFNK